MILRLLGLALLLASPLATLADLPADSPAAPAWQPLLAALKARQPLLATFEERRYFPFKKNPVLLTGEIRLDPARGLSLHYQVPEERILVIDDRGGFMRDGQGRRLHDLPDDPRAQAATRALLHVMRFQLDPLAKDFSLGAARAGDTWTFTFTPLPGGPLASVLQPIVITGRDSLVQTLSFRKTPAEHTEIQILATHPNITFPPSDLTRFFR